MAGAVPAEGLENVSPRALVAVSSTIVCNGLLAFGSVCHCVMTGMRQHSSQLSD